MANIVHGRSGCTDMGDILIEHPMLELRLVPVSEPDRLHAYLEWEDEKKIMFYSLDAFVESSETKGYRWLYGATIINDRTVILHYTMDEWRIGIEHRKLTLTNNHGFNLVKWKTPSDNSITPFTPMIRANDLKSTSWIVEQSDDSTSSSPSNFRTYYYRKNALWVTNLSIFFPDPRITFVRKRLQTLIFPTMMLHLIKETCDLVLDYILII